MERKTIDPAACRPGPGLRFLYDTVPGRCLLKLAVRPGLSRMAGRFLDTSLSKPLIPRFIRKHKIDMSRYEAYSYPSFNAFFTRPLRPEFLLREEGLTAPCDGKLTVYPITPDAVFTVKGSTYSLPDILDSAALTREFQGGYCLVFRLTVEDLHRYCYFDDCTEGENCFLPGVLHTVQPIALRRYPVFRQNAREYTVLKTAHFGKAVQVEVGATCVGRILNYHQPGIHRKGEEKGMFLFGGSTILLLIGRAEIDGDILQNSASGLETVVRMGEAIGRPLPQ